MYAKQVIRVLDSKSKNILYLISLTKICQKVLLILFDNLTNKYYNKDMKTLPVGELKTHFSEILNDVKSGEEIIITYGKKKENIAVIVPYTTYKKKNKIKLGLLKDKNMKIQEDFKMTEEELIIL